MAAIFYGNWLTEDFIRGTSGGTVSAAHQLLLAYPEDLDKPATAVVSACNALKFDCTMWNYKQESSPQAPAFLRWVKSHLSTGSPVITGLYWGVESDSDYDHIVPLVGYDTLGSDVSVLFFNDLHTNGSIRAEVSTFVATRKHCASSERFGQQSFCLPRNRNYGVAVMGNRDAEGALRPVRLEMSSWTEPDYSREDAQQQKPRLLLAAATASALSPGKRYAMLRFDCADAVPEKAFLQAAFAQKTVFVAVTSTWTQAVNFMSNTTQFFRCVELPPGPVAAPDAATQAPSAGGKRGVSGTEVPSRRAPPSCAHAQDGSCPPPRWEAHWALNLSTVVQPCNASGLFRSSALYGLASFDWSNAKAAWASLPNNATNCSEMLLQQAAITKAIDPRTRVFVYRNFLLALEWLRGQRAAMDDPTKQGYFVHYQAGARRGEIYNEPQLHGLRQYFWNFSNPAAVEYFIAEATSDDAVGNALVDGIFTDDVDGTFQEHAQACRNMGMSEAQVAQVEDDNQKAYAKLLDALVAKDAYNWQAFGAEDGTTSLLPVGQKDCAETMRRLCEPTTSLSSQPRLVTAVGGVQGVAAFLLARGPHWWMGWGWEGCSDVAPHTYDPLWSIDPGPPSGGCIEALAGGKEGQEGGVFTRDFAQGRATLNCNTWEATLDFKKP